MLLPHLNLEVHQTESCMSIVTVPPGDHALFTNLGAGDEQIVDGIAAVTQIDAGGRQEVEAGGLAVVTTVAAGGTEVIKSGGTAIATEIAGGLQDVEVGGVAN